MKAVVNARQSVLDRGLSWAGRDLEPPPFAPPARRAHGPRRLCPGGAAERGRRHGGLMGRREAWQPSLGPDPLHRSAFSPGSTRLARVRPVSLERTHSRAMTTPPIPASPRIRSPVLLRRLFDPRAHRSLAVLVLTLCVLLGGSPTPDSVAAAAEGRAEAASLAPAASGRPGSAPAPAPPPSSAPAWSSPPGAVPVPTSRSVSAWVWPLEPPVVVRGFTPPATPWGPGHRGVDLLGAVGSPVLAAGDGVVTFAGQVAGREVITVAHAVPTGVSARSEPNVPWHVWTTYEPVRPRVRVGDRVHAGRPIGVLVATMSHCPPRACLHWGARTGDGRYVDPRDLLTGRPRLLPLGRRPRW